MIFFFYCDDVWLLAVYEVFWFLDFVSDVVYVDLKYDDVFVLWLTAICEVFCVGDVLLFMALLFQIVLMVHLQSGLYYRCFICVHST